MSGRLPYVRTMRGWWLRDPYYIEYMAREATALLVAAYAVVLLVGLWRLSEGQVAYEGWLRALKSPAALLFHGVVFVTFVYHTWSWFRIMPKTMPLLFVGGKRVGATAITVAGLAAAVVASAVLIFAVGRLA